MIEVICARCDELYAPCSDCALPCPWLLLVAIAHVLQLLSQVEAEEVVSLPVAGGVKSCSRTVVATASSHTLDSPPSRRSPCPFLPITLLLFCIDGLTPVSFSPS